MDFKDYYEILNIPTTKVSFEEIKLAYRNQAKKYHPDLNVKNADEIIKDINEAYKVLSDESSKKKYDRLWKSYVGKHKRENMTYDNVGRSGSLADEVFEVLLGKKIYKKIKKKTVRKQDKTDNEENLVKNNKNNIFVNLKITIEEAYLGATKKIVHNDAEIEVLIPKKSKPRDLIRIKGEGKKDDLGKKGDLIISLDISNEKDSKYLLDGLNIIVNLNIYPSEAVIGAKIEREILGKPMSIIIPPKVKQGKEICIKNKGFKSSTGKLGDLILKINIVTPDEINEKQAELYKELYEIEKFMNH